MSDPLWVPALFVILGAGGGLAYAAFNSRRFIRPDRMFTAIANGETERIRAHLARYGDADIDWPDHDGYTPLLAAIVDKKPQIALLFLDAGADFERSAETRATPLVLAALRNQPEVVDALLAKGARTNVPDDEGLTALHHAVAHNDGKMLAALLKAGANPNFKDAFGVTPLDRAHAQPEFAAALQGAGGKPGSEVLMADVLAALEPADRERFDLPRAWGLKKDDPRLVAAKERAQADVATLQDAVSRQVYARVKFAIENEQGLGEALWAEVIEGVDGGVSVHVLGSPLTREPYDGPLTLTWGELVDWEFEEPQDVLRGGFTKRVTFEAMRTEFGYLPADIEEELAMYVDP